jgi:two-component system sensor histidine kinase VicK
MDFHSESTIDRMMLSDVPVRIVHAIAVIGFALLFSRDASASQMMVVLALGALVLFQSIIPITLPKFRQLSGAWPTIGLHLVAFSIVSLWFLEPGSIYELSWLVLVIAASYWRGVPGFMVSATGVSAIWIINAASNDALIGNTYLAGYIFVTLVCGALLARYSELQLKERDSINKTKQQAVVEGTQLRSLINSMADAVIATDQKGVIQLYNAAALLLLNTNQGLKDTQLSDLLKFTDSEGNVVDIFAEAQQIQRIIQRDDLVFTNNRDEEVNLYLDLAPIRTAQSNEINGYIFLLRDITKQKSIEEQRDDFISIISHELRTPIAIAEGNLSTALMDSVTDEDKKINMIDQAHQNVLFLAQLVNDITTLAHAERGDLDEEKMEINPRDFITEIGENYKSNIKEANLKLDFDIDDDLPQLRVHSQRLKEIMQDYLTNAIRYTDEGTITIVGHELSPNIVRLGVKDTGIGMSKSDQARVFEKFYRSEDYRTRQHNGTGLGLYIAKKLSELIDVRIGVESKLNEGSLFYIDINH